MLAKKDVLKLILDTLQVSKKYFFLLICSIEQRGKLHSLFGFLFDGDNELLKLEKESFVWLLQT